MCLMIWKPAHAVLTKRDVYDYVKHNPDGFGVAWFEDGRVKTYKMVGYGKKAIWRAYQEYAAGRDCALHWRMATAGAINLDMTHPFKVNEKTILMHNGMLSCASTPERSDTAHFCDIMARELEKHPERLDDPAYIKALDDVIGSGNRLLFMRDGDSEPIIVGKQKGVEHNGCWYSNCYAWSNDYYDAHDWGGYGKWSWSDKYDTDNEHPLDVKYGTTTTAEQTFLPRTYKEEKVLEEAERWFRDYQYANPQDVIDYFVDWYGDKDAAKEHRLRQVLEYNFNKL
jgi:glutamate synthase domain-containing protein 1